MSSLKDFCKTKDPNILKNLDNYTKRLLIAASKYCMDNKVGHQDIANLIEKEIGKWEYIIIPKGTLLYRGGDDSLLKPTDRATYYTNNIDTANIYLPLNKQGLLGIYKVKEDIMLFKLDSIDNANNLLSVLHSDKTIVYKHKTKLFTIEETLYDIVRKIYTGQFTDKPDNEPLVLRRLYRDSVTNKDFIFANWLCKEGFNGYNADEMRQRLVKTKFPAEVMLCNPTKVLEVTDYIKMRRTKSKKILEKIKKQYE
jgi:hypothetical protein